MAARITRAKKKIAAARHPVRRARAGDLARAAGRGADRRAPALDDRPHRAVGRAAGARRPGRARAGPGPHAARCCCPPSARSPACSRCCWSTMRARRARDPRATCCARGPGPLGVGRALIAEADELIVGALRAGPPGRFTLQAAIAACTRGAELRGDRLAAAARRSTTCCCASGRRRSSRSTARSWWRWCDGRRRRWRRSRRSSATAARRLPLPAGDQGRPPAPPRPPRGGGRRLPRGAAPHRERDRARVPRGAPGVRPL